MPTVCSDPEFEKNIELKRCRKDRESIIKKIGYSDECNPFGDSLLSTPFIWEKRFEQEKNEKYDEFLENCKNYRWYKFGVAPINIEKILEIRKRREVSDENSTRRPQRGNLFNYDTWIENEKKFEKLQIQSSSIIRIKEHRENIFDIIFWKVLTYSFFCEGNSFEETESISPLTHSLLSLTLVGLSGSLPYLISLCDKKLLPWVDNLMKRPNLDKNIHFIEFTSMLKQHKKIINTSTEIKLVEEWVDILDGLDVMINLEYNHNDKDSMENHEIKEIIKNKSLAELRSIISEAQNLLNDEYWNNVVLNIKVFIARLNIEKIENIYNLNIESWATELLKKYNISSQVLKFECEENSTLEKISNNNENDFSEDESSGQLIDLPFIEFSVPTSNNERKTIKENNLELQLPIVYSKIKAKYIWNQYNRNYYNEKSLPPKIIQGYRFKIIFPLLNRPENKHITPNWYLTTKKRYIENNNISIIDENKTIEDLLECEGEVPQKSKLLIISCNQCKYKDIGFSIIDREWETNPKYGYRSYFENATLYLNFNFKQKRYRR
ncbi:cactin-like protein [Cryptosporidium xiaoi]|uniref:Cactin-like protein n=1 Tax=Cryptosporidium xiaoi TaxID=659607 RepID=A0AAV9XXF5_9CRYT